MHIMLEHGTSSASGDKLQLLMRTGLSTAPVWPVAVDILARAPLIGPEYMTLDDAYMELLAGRMQLWMSNTTDRFTSAMLTDIISAKDAKVLRLRWVASEDLSAILPFLDTVERWAWQEGARWSCIVESRLGFERVLRPYGYADRAVTLYKRLGAVTEH